MIHHCFIWKNVDGVQMEVDTDMVENKGDSYQVNEDDPDQVNNSQSSTSTILSSNITVKSVGIEHFLKKKGILTGSIIQLFHEKYLNKVSCISCKKQIQYKF